MRTFLVAVGGVAAFALPLGIYAAAAAPISVTASQASATGAFAPYDIQSVTLDDSDDSDDFTLGAWMRVPENCPAGARIVAGRTYELVPASAASIPVAIAGVKKGG